MTHAHHRKRRSQNGDDSWGNLIELPPEVHELVHRQPEIAYQHGLLVHSYDDPSEIRPDVAGFLSSLGIEAQEKPKRKKLDTAERRKRRRISIAVPNDTEDGGAIWDETISEVKRRLVALDLYDDVTTIPNYEAVIAGLRDWLNSA